MALTPTQRQMKIDPRLIQALQMQKQGSSTAPVQSPLEGIARALQAPAGAWAYQRAEESIEDEATQERREKAEALADILVGSQADIPGQGPTVERAGQLDAINAQRQPIVDALSSGAVPLETAQEAAGRQMFPEPVDPKDRYMNVPGVGLVDVGAGDPRVAIERGLDPRDAAFAQLSPEQQQRALGAAPPPLSPRDAAFARLSPEQQAMALGAEQAPSVPSGFQRTEDGLAPIPGGPADPAYMAGKPRVVTDPVTNQPFSVDLSTGTSTPLNVPVSGSNMQTEPVDAPVLADVTRYGPEGYGPETAAKYTFGALGSDAENTAQRQKYRLLRETMIDAFKRSDRPSNYAQQRVEELMPSTGVFESPSRAYDALSSTHEYLTRNVADDTQIANNPALPPKVRQEAVSRVVAANRALAQIGDPSQFPRPGSEEDADGAPQAPQTPAVGTIEDGYRFTGGDPADPNSWEPMGPGQGVAR